jgi:acetylornithine deacetylase
MIQGGQQVNMIPDSCWADVDRRLLPHENPEEILAEVRKIVNANIAGVGKIKFEKPYVCVEAMETPPDIAIVQAMSRASKKIIRKANIRGAAFTSDASYIAKRGIPVVVFGPGSIDHAHSRDEFVKIDEVMKAALILAQAAAGYPDVEKGDGRWKD